MSFWESPFTREKFSKLYRQIDQSSKQWHQLKKKIALGPFSGKMNGHFAFFENKEMERLQ